MTAASKRLAALAAPDRPEQPADRTRRRYDRGHFGKGTAGGQGRCSWSNLHRGGPDGYVCGPPVVEEYRTRVRDGWGKHPAGGWYSLCERCAARP